MTSHDPYGERWFDHEAGPVVRPYAVTNGRTLPNGSASFGLIDVVVATGERSSEHFRPGPSTGGSSASAAAQPPSST